MIPIIDAHLDLAWNALSWNRDLTEPLAVLREREKGMSDDPARGNATVCLPEMRRGRVVLCLATILVRAKRQVQPARGHLRIDLDFGTQTIACATARGQLEYYRLLEEQNELRIIHNRTQLDRHWQQAQQDANGPVGIILAMEGADPIVSPAQVQRWFDDGLRVVGIAHYGPSAYGVGTGDSGPLTPAGIELLGEMDRLGMILDLTHSSDPTFYQALEVFAGPVLASHNNCRALVAGDRQYSDDQIRRIIERGGVIGAVLDEWQLRAGWERGKTDRNLVTLDAVADNIDHVCQLAGNARHSAIGSDLDGGFGTEQSPVGIESIADMQKLADVLARRGYGSADIEGIFYGNWLRFFREHLKG
ncbi:MAG TPA: membrane dipeptidase [Tepidisphaeraceae bacterium]|nr:membrane dipeptidase [Tepidisphaeraceae bacterium]